MSDIVKTIMAGVAIMLVSILLMYFSSFIEEMFTQAFVRIVSILGMVLGLMVFTSIGSDE